MPDSEPKLIAARLHWMAFQWKTSDNMGTCYKHKNIRILSLNSMMGLFRSRRYIRVKRVLRVHITYVPNASLIKSRNLQRPYANETKKSKFFR